MKSSFTNQQSHSPDSASLFNKFSYTIDAFLQKIFAFPHISVRMSDKTVSYHFIPQLYVHNARISNHFKVTWSFKGAVAAISPEEEEEGDEEEKDGDG